MSAPRAVVVVMGPAGAGKSTVGRALAAALGWPFHDADDLHSSENVERMRAGIALGDAERLTWLAALAALVARSLASGTSIVLACSALTREYRRRLVPPDAPAGAVRLVYLRADAALLATRLAERTGHFFPPALLASQLATLEEPGAGEPAPALVVDAAAPVDAVVAAVRAGLDI